MNGRQTDIPVTEQSMESAATLLFRRAQEDPSIPMRSLLRHCRRPDDRFFRKSDLVEIYRRLTTRGEMEEDPELFEKLRVKPRRTQSGVTTVTVLTKPYPCPGKCVFCPTDARMPKSYLPDEPGAMRAEMNAFDPFDQVFNRIRALRVNGHPADKIELLILGGTWSAYTNEYQEWFLKRCLDAMNGTDAESLVAAQIENETASQRNVGLVIETRPDHIRPREVRRLRWLGVTKVQMGLQSTSDEILEKNQRGHDLESTRKAMTLLRAAGFKVVLHWMPNLLGATPDLDRADFEKIWSDPGLKPDEIKIYPCSLLPNAELYEYWKRGEYEPYEDRPLIELVADCKAMVARYCRINRVYRDIPAHNIVAGAKINNLRQHAEQELERTGRRCHCIRCREVVAREISKANVRFQSQEYEARESRERFLSFDTEDDRLAGYLRLSLPVQDASLRVAPPLEIPEIESAAIVREVHVYGQAQAFGKASEGAAQHVGLGKSLMAEAETMAKSEGYRRLAVIASIGTRRYYASLGYRLDGTYMVKELV